MKITIIRADFNTSGLKFIPLNDYITALPKKLGALIGSDRKISNVFLKPPSSLSRSLVALPDPSEAT